MTSDQSVASWLPDDIRQRIETDYPQQSVTDIATRLAEYRGHDRMRVIRCILHLSSGDFSKFLHNVGVALTDYRNVIYWAEYGLQDQRIRDFNQPFVAQPTVQADAPASGGSAG